MVEKGKFLEYTGQIDYRMIDRLLKKFKRSQEFIKLDKTTGKRSYAILVECLENIAKHSEKKYSKIEPTISVIKERDNVVIKISNPVSNDKAGELVRKLDQVNSLDEKVLKTLYENKINKVSNPEENGAGLGFMLMKLKSGNNINYKLTKANNDYTYFEIKISVNEYIMRKLIINQTSNSPKVILDPDRKIFEISGESRPPDVPVFYKEILTWADDYAMHLSRSYESKDPVEFNFDFEYFNSSSAKYILDLCKQLGRVRLNGKNVTVRWHYEDDDIDMLEAGREMSRLAKVPFEYIQKDNDSNK